jgi:hypothetical protein
MNYDINMIFGHRLKPLTEYELRGRASKNDDDAPRLPSRYELANGNGGKKGNHFS